MPASPIRANTIGRLGVLGVALVMGLALVGSAIQSFRMADQRASLLVGAQVRLVLGSLAARLRPESGVPEQDELAQLLVENAEQGLRYIAFVDSGGRPLVEAGRALGASRPLPLPGRQERLAGRIRLLAPPPGPPGLESLPTPGGGPPFAPGAGPPPPAPGAGPPPPGAWPPPPRGAAPGAAEPSAPPRLLLEIEPAIAQSLVTEARQSLLISCATALLLGLAAILLYRHSAARERLERDALRQRHLATLGEMSAVLAHEIRNPLAVAKGHAQLLAERAEDERQKRWVAQVVQSLERLEALTADLLELAKSGEIHPEPTSLEDFLGGVLRDVGAERVRLDTQGAPPRWTLDAGHMHTVLVNLLRNALQASPETEPVQLSATERSGALVLRVQDLGPGISPDDLERIFEAFHTTRTRGAGLGLAIARRIVQLHGGRIHAANRSGGGALFEVTLPRA